MESEIAALQVGQAGGRCPQILICSRGAGTAVLYALEVLNTYE